jgi:predicted metalloendopeptidase
LDVGTGKQQALAKLAALQVIVGYPDVWIDYSSLDVVRGDAFGNMRRAEAFIVCVTCQVETTGRSDRVANQSASSRCGHHVQP